jgi:hypothetical protein
MKDRFDLEQDIMNCWGITDDLQLLLRLVDEGKYDSLSPSDTDDLANILMGLCHVYGMKFNRLFDTFGDCIEELTPPEPNLPNDQRGRLNDVTPEEWNSLR